MIGKVRIKIIQDGYYFISRIHMAINHLPVNGFFHTLLKRMIKHLLFVSPREEILSFGFAKVIDFANNC